MNKNIKIATRWHSLVSFRNGTKVVSGCGELHHTKQKWETVSLVVAKAINAAANSIRAGWHFLSEGKNTRAFQ